MTEPVPQQQQPLLERRGRLAWQRWFPMVWLVFIAFPIAGLLNTPRPLLELLYGLALVLGFTLIFVWVFFWPRAEGAYLERPYRLPSIVGMVMSYAVFGLLWPLVQGNAVGLLVYAGSMAGFQRSIKPSLLSIAAALVCAVTFALQGSGWLIWSIAFFTVVAALGNHSSYREMIAQKLLERSREEVVSLAKVTERERIARDLHDLLGHTLSVIVLKSELASRLADKDPARSISEIRDVERIARDALSEVRSAVRGMRQATLEGELQSVRLACDAADLKLELYLEPLALPSATEQTLSFALREAVTNVIRHAKASVVTVRLERTAQNVRLTVADDGAGAMRDGNGLRGMRERLELNGGTLELSAKRLTAALPLEGSA